jgi:hypothetical protein
VKCFLKVSPAGGWTGELPLCHKLQVSLNEKQNQVSLNERQVNWLPKAVNVLMWLQHRLVALVFVEN